MSPKKIKTRRTAQSEYRIYRKKAKEFYETMYHAEKAENWNAVGLNGVHTVISIIDALLVKHSGIRSAEESHMKVVDLLTFIWEKKSRTYKPKAKQLGVLSQRKILLHMKIEIF